jgi:predicted nucleotidyltransferase
MTAIIKEHQQAIERLCEQYGVLRLEVFGSAAGGEKFNIQTSDVDFLVEFQPMEPPKHARAYFGLLEALQDMFSRPVDLVEIKAINNPYLMESINENRSCVYAA